MKIIIEGTEKEIAELVLALQAQRREISVKRLADDIVGNITLFAEREES